MVCMPQVVLKTLLWWIWDGWQQQLLTLAEQIFHQELLDKSPMFLTEQLGIETISNQHNCVFNDDANVKNLAEWDRDHWIRKEG